MSGIFGVLDIAARAMQINQSGIQTTGHNIANVDTPGYSRQRQVLRSELPQVHPAGQLGTGVRQLTIERITDQFLQRSLVAEHSTAGSTEVQARSLAQVELVFNEQLGPGLSAALQAFYDSFEDLAASSHPTGATERDQVRFKAEALIDQLHRMDSELRDQQRSTDRSITGVLDAVNDLSTRIQQLNDEIVRTEVVAPANDLRDQRDQAVRDLAHLIDVTTYERPEGDLVVMMKSNGMTLVEGPSVGQLSTQPDPTNPFDGTFVDILFDNGGGQVNVTSLIGGGELGGLLAVRDTVVPAAIRSLDTIAYNLIDAVNAQHQAGYALDDSTGLDFFTAVAQVEDTARDISLDAIILASTDNIAAAGAGGGPPAEPGDRDNAQALADLRDAASAIFLPGDPPGPATGPTRTLLDHTAATIADIGQQSRTMQEANDQQELIVQSLENRRDEVSGVSIDEEVVNLVRLQAAFQANARVIATVQVMLDELVATI